MSVLSSLLARDQVVAVKKIEEAIQRQVISGGDLPTVLLEVGAAAENVIAAYHAASIDLVPAARDEVMDVGEDVTRVLPRGLAERFATVPLAIESNTLVVAAANPLPSSAISEIGEATGRRVEIRIVTEPRIAAALQQHYGVAPIARMRRLIARLAVLEAGEIPEVSAIVENRRNSITPLGSAAPASSASWLRASTGGATAEAAGSNTRGNASNARSPAPEAAPIDAPSESKAPAVSTKTTTSTVVTVGVSRVVGVGTASKPSTTEYRREPPSGGANALANSDRPILASIPSPEPVRLEGTLDADAAVAALAVASDRHAILTAAFAHIRTYFSYCAVFAVHEDGAEGLDASGDGASPEAVRTIGLDLSRPGTARDVRELLGAKAGSLDATDADRDLVTKLDRAAKQPSVLFPVAIRQRVVFLFYGDRAGGALGVGDIGELMSFLPRVSDALQRLILQRKRRSDQTGPSTLLKSDAAAPWSKPGSEAATDADLERDSAPELGQAPVATPVTDAPVVGSDVAATPTVDAAPPSDAVADFANKPPSERPRAFDLLGVPRKAPEPPSLVTPDPAPASGPVPDAAPEPEAAAPQAALEAAEQRVAPIESQPPARPSSRPPGDTMYRGGGGSEEEVVLTRRKSRASARPSTAPVSHEIIPRPASIPVEARPSVDSSRPDFDDDDDDSDGPEISVNDSLPPPQSDATIITDLGLDLDDLVDELVKSSREDVDPHVEKLVGFGEPALRVLTRRFPGPLWIPERIGAEGPHPRARDVGPILNAMVMFRGLAVAHVANLLDQRDPEIRYYAALLAADLPHRDLVVRVGRRVLDDDATVRAASLVALRASKRFEGELAEVLTHFRRVAGNDRAPIALRRLSVELLGELRDGDGVAMLVDTLGDPDSELSRGAREALRRITKQDFGPTTATWQTWLSAHGDDHRIEWLIDALLHDDETHRREAGDELKVATKEFFGFQAALPRKEREVVHRKYRKWWDAIGRARFHRV